MTIAILATIALVLFVLLVFKFTVRILENESNKEWMKMLERLLEEKRAELASKSHAMNNIPDTEYSFTAEKLNRVKHLGLPYE